MATPPPPVVELVAGILGGMLLAQELPTWGPLALKLASIAALSGALVVVLRVWWNRK